MSEHHQRILRVADRSGQLQLHNPVENFDRFGFVEFHDINLRQRDVVFELCKLGVCSLRLLSPGRIQAQVNMALLANVGAKPIFQGWSYVRAGRVVRPRYLKLAEW